MLRGVLPALDPWEGIVNQTAVTVGTVEGMYTDNFRVATSPLLNPAVSVQIEVKPGDDPLAAPYVHFEYLTPCNARELAALLTASADQVEEGTRA